MSFRTYFNWSTGKDSALALYTMLQDTTYSIDKLVTTLNTDTNRVSMHGVRRELLIKQCESIGIQLNIIELPGVVSMNSYDDVMQSATLDLKQQGFTHAVFGDIFLEDLREYRMDRLKRVGLQAYFPLWKMDSHELIHRFIQLGFKAVTVAVNAKVLDDSMVGRVIDEDFLRHLPKGVDPCGENGEFHTFVYDGPIFSRPIDFTVGEKVLKTYSPSKNQDDDCFKKDTSWDSSFWFCDLL